MKNLIIIHSFIPQLIGFIPSFYQWFKSRMGCRYHVEHQHNSSKGTKMKRKGMRNEEEEESSSILEDAVDVRWESCSVFVERSAAIEEEANKFGGYKTFKLNTLSKGKTILIPIL